MCSYNSKLPDNIDLPNSDFSKARSEIANIVAMLLLQCLKVRKRQLVSKGKRHARMLEHVVERQVLDQILGAMDVVIRVLECRFNNECRRIPGLGSRGMVGAGVSALGLDEGDIAVLPRQSAIAM